MLEHKVRQNTRSLSLPHDAQINLMTPEEQWDLVNEREECAVMISTIPEYDI